MQSPIVPVILAAGNSSRMGYPKALLPLGGGTFLTTILNATARLGLPRPMVVLGRDAARIAPLLDRQEVSVLVNPDPDRGQISSLQAALAATDPALMGCLVWPVDQPCVPAPLVADLLALCVRKRAPLGLPVCRGRRGHPAFFHRVLFPELLEVRSGCGAREVVLRNLERAALLDTDDASVVEDIDTPEDYYRLTGKTLLQALPPD